MRADHSTLREALATKNRVFQALTIRHIAARYGRHDLGFLWIVVEPMILCVGVMSIWRLTKGPYEHGVDLAAFVYTGYMPLTLWRHLTNNMAYVMRASKFLINYRGITFSDIIFARLFLELIGCTGAAIFVYLVLYLAGVLPPIYSIALVLEGWAIMASLGFAGGLVLGTVIEMKEIMEKFIQPAQYLMLPFSGCFYMLGWLPDSARDALLYVPFVHAFEIIRAGVFGPTVATYGSPSYALGCAVVWAAVGCLLLKHVEHRIEG